MNEDSFSTLAQGNDRIGVWSKRNNVKTFYSTLERRGMHSHAGAVGKRGKFETRHVGM